MLWQTELDMRYPRHTYTRTSWMERHEILASFHTEYNKSNILSRRITLETERESVVALSRFMDLAWVHALAWNHRSRFVRTATASSLSPLKASIHTRHKFIHRRSMAKHSIYIRVQDKTLILWSISSGYYTAEDLLLFTWKSVSEAIVLGSRTFLWPSHARFVSRRRASSSNRIECVRSRWHSIVRNYVRFLWAMYSIGLRTAK